MQSNVKPKFYYDPARFEETDNNDLEGSAIALEEVRFQTIADHYICKIYTNTTWPPGAPFLTKSLKSNGKSRADLWAFAALVALERSIERANYACDHDYHVRQQVRSSLF